MALKLELHGGGAGRAWISDGVPGYGLKTCEAAAVLKQSSSEWSWVWSKSGGIKTTWEPDEFHNGRKVRYKYNKIINDFKK